MSDEKHGMSALNVEEDAALQDMWSGLLASARTEQGDNDSNLIFIKLLADMTRLQVRILKFACETVPAYVQPGGLTDPTSRSDSWMCSTREIVAVVPALQ